MAGRKIDAGYVTMEFAPAIEEIQRDLRDLARDLNNLNPFLRDVVRQVLIPSIQTNFERGGRPAWEPLKQSTVERRLRTGTGTQILVESGRLERAATQFSRWSFDREKAQISNWPSNVVTRAAVHQGGAVVNFSGGERRVARKAGESRFSRRRKTAVKPYTSNIPARPFLAIQDEDADKAMDMFGDFVESRARRRWR